MRGSESCLFMSVVLLEHMRLLIVACCFSTRYIVCVTVMKLLWIGLFSLIDLFACAETEEDWKSGLSRIDFVDDKYCRCGLWGEQGAVVCIVEFPGLHCFSKVSSLTNFPDQLAWRSRSTFDGLARIALFEIVKTSILSPLSRKKAVKDINLYFIYKRFMDSDWILPIHNFLTKLPENW